MTVAPGRPETQAFDTAIARKPNGAGKPQTPLDFEEELIKREGVTAAVWAKRPIDRRFWTAWAAWFNRIFRENVEPDAQQAIYETLLFKQFTNRDLRMAADHILDTCRHWPYVVDFLKCPDLDRNDGK